MQAKKLNDETLKAHFSLFGVTAPLFKIQIKFLKFLAALSLSI